MKFSKFVRMAVFTLVASLAAHAADFEGTVLWSFKAEVTDPELKKQMGEARQQLADPAQLAQMKAMLADPKMKVILAQNPHMKTAMEGQIKAAEDAAAGKGGGDMVTTMMPKGMTLQAKGGRTRMLLEGGAMPMDVLGRAQPAESLIIDREARTFSRVPAAPVKTADETSSHRVTKTAATTKILGYTCEQYLVEMRQNGEKVSGVFWATDDIPGLDFAVLAQSRLGGDDARLLEEIAGVPLKMEMTMAQMKIVVQTTAIQPGKIDDSVFEVPAGFTEKPYAPAKPIAAPTK